MTDFMVSREEKSVTNSQVTQKPRLTGIGRGSHASRQCQGAFYRDRGKYEATGTGKSIYVIPCELSFVKKSTRSADKFGVKKSSQFIGSPWGSGCILSSSLLSTPDKENLSTNSCRSATSPGWSCKITEASEKIFINDPNLLHTFARYVTGNVVDIHTRKNEVIRGVICGFHQGVNFSVDKPVIIDVSSQRISRKLNSPLVLNRDDIVEIHARDIDKDEVIQNNMTAPDASNSANSVLRTDAEIASDSFRSRPNGGDAPEDGIQLKPFYDAGSEPKEVDGFELNGDDGWSAKQMFSKNESLGVSSTYDPTLADYTTELRKEDTVEYREREARASALAAEIESSSESRNMAECENDDGDDDEESRFSAVHRQQSGPYSYNRGNGRNVHSDRSMSHFGSSRGGGPQSLRSGGRGQSYRSAVEGGVNSGPKSSGPNTHSRASKESLVRFSNNFRLAKSGPGSGGPPMQTSSSSGPRKSDPGSLKSSGRGKRAYNQTPSSASNPGSGRMKHGDEPPEGTSVNESKHDNSGRRNSDVEKMRRDEVKVEEEKGMMTESTAKAMPTCIPSTSSNKSKSNDPEETGDSQDIAVDSSTKESGPSANEAGDQAVDANSATSPDSANVSIKSSLNVDAQPFFPTSWSSPTSTPANVPVQSPPAAPLATGVGALNLGQPRGPQHPQAIHHQALHIPYQVPQPPPIAAPLQNQPLQVPVTALGHVQPGGTGGLEVAAHHNQNHHGHLFIPPPGSTPRFSGPPVHVTHHNPNAIPAPAYQVQHHLPGGHGSVSQGVQLNPHGQGAMSAANHARNGNGAPKQRSAVVSVQSGGPVMNRGGGNPEAQAAAMTGAPLVAPNPHAGQPVHPSTPHAPPYHASQRVDWPQGYNPYGAVSSAQLGQQPTREGAGSQPGANISNPPTPSSTPQQAATFLTQPTVAQMGHPTQYVYQQMAQGGPTAPAPQMFSQQGMGALAQYPHHNPHMTATGQAMGPSSSTIMAPPGALMLYQTTLPGHHHQGASVSHQPGQPHHPQPHHQTQQQQQMQPMVIPMYTHPAHAAQHPSHMQQHHTQQQHHQQQQHAAAALHQVMQQAGGPLQQFQQSAHAHGHPHSIHNLSYAQGPGAAQYMTQSQHAAHTIPQHAPQ